MSPYLRLRLDSCFLVLMRVLVGQDAVRWPDRTRASEAAHNVIQARRHQGDDSRAVEGKESR